MEAAAALARRRARQGIDIEVLIGAYHLGDENLWEAITQAADTETEGVLPRAASLLFASLPALATALAAAGQNGLPDPMRAFEALGRAYLAFARQEPAYYAAMFETRIALDSHPGLLAASDRAFAILRDAAERLTVALPPNRRPPSLMIALHVWALSHGIASLFVRPDPSRRKLPMSPEDLLEAGVLIYLQGLGLAGGPAMPS